MAGYYALFGGEYTLPDLLRIQGERAGTEVRLADEREDLTRLRARADSLEHDLGTLERLARERFGLIRDGEVLYRFAEDAERPGAEGLEAGPTRLDTPTPRR